MAEDRSKDIESIRKMSEDAWYETFTGAVEHYVEWELLVR